jgi:hypothetical protein
MTVASGQGTNDAVAICFGIVCRHLSLTFTGRARALWVVSLIGSERLRRRGRGSSGTPPPATAEPSDLKYSTPPAFTINFAITPLKPTVNGEVTTYNVSPPLPPGLTLTGTATTPPRHSSVGATILSYARRTRDSTPSAARGAPCCFLSEGSTTQVTVRARITPARALPRKCGTRQKIWLPRRTRWPRTW